MSLVRYEPWNALGQLHQQINQIFDSRYRDDTASGATADWAPPADVEEYSDRFMLKLDLPGVNLASVNITLDKDVLSISGEREKETVSKDIERGRMERPRGAFYRRFALPEIADSTGVRATGRNGVLEVVIPKQPKAQPRRIEVAAH